MLKLIWKKHAVFPWEHGMFSFFGSGIKNDAPLINSLDRFSLLDYPQIT